MLGQEGAIAVLTPAGTLDPSFGGGAQDAPAFRVRMPPQAASGRMQVTVRTSGLGLMRLRVRVAGAVVADTVRAAMAGGDRVLQVRLSATTVKRLRRHPRSRLTVSATFRDALGRDARAVVRGRPFNR